MSNQQSLENTVIVSAKNVKLGSIKVRISSAIKIYNLVQKHVSSCLIPDSPFINMFKLLKAIETKYEYLCSGATGHILKATSKNGRTFIIKIVSLHNIAEYGDIYNPNRPENVEYNILSRLTNLVCSEIIPHLELPILRFYSPLLPIKDIIVDLAQNTDTEVLVKHFQTLLENNKYHSVASILFVEYADNGDLRTFITKNMKTITTHVLRIFFFQIISTLAVIQQLYPTFRHNDLNVNNVLVHSKKKSQGKKVKYTVNGNSYILPNIEHQLRLWDFDYANIQGLIDNKRVVNDRSKSLGITANANRYYDLHFFFNNFINSFEKDLAKSADPEIVNLMLFLGRVVPTKYRNTRSRRLPNNTEYTTPLYLIENDDFFERFRK